MPYNSAAAATTAGSAKDCATSSTASSVAVVVDAAVSPDDIAGTNGSVPGMATATSSLLSSGEAPQAGECVQVVAMCNIESIKSKAKAAKHVLITL